MRTVCYNCCAIGAVARAPNCERDWYKDWELELELGLALAACRLAILANECIIGAQASALASTSAYMHTDSLCVSRPF